MKKILYSLAAVATLLFAASCAKDKETALPDYLMGGSPVEVTFGVNAGQGLMTKAIADGLTATKLTVGWYEVTDNGPVYCNKTDKNLSNLTGDVTLTLLKGKTYKIVFWAAPVEGSPYELDWNNNEVVGASTLTANDEKNDAFYAVAEYEVLAQNEAQTITLTRPLAQIAVISPKANIDDNEAQLDDSGIVVAAAPTKMNLLTGETSTNAEITFTNAAPALEALTWKQEDYYYVAVGYVFAPANGAVSDISFNANNQEATTYDVQSASLKRNYRTVIAGNILPAADPNADVEWTVTVDPSFGGENEANMEAQVPEVTFTDPDDPQADPLPAPYDENLDVNESMDLDPDTPTAMFQVNSPSAAPIQVASDNEEVATAEIDGENMVTITAVGNGQALITISQDAYQEAANPAPGLHKAPGDNYAAYSYTFLVVVSDMEEIVPGEGFTFTKVTSISAGEYLIVCESENVAFNGALTEKLDVASNNIAVTIENGKIVLENKNAIFTVAAVDGGYSIKSASGIYIGGESGANKIVESTTEAYVNTVAFSEGNAIITSNTSFIQYNKTSGQERFRYYKANTTSQQPVALYKLSGGSEPEPPQPGEPADAVITLSGVPTEALAAGASFDLVVSTESTGEIAVAADPAEAVTIAPKANADNTWTVTAAELEADTEVTLTVTTAAVENTWKAGEETATFTVAKKTGGEVPPVEGNDGSAEHPYTVAEAIALIDAGAPTDEVHVTGVVTTVGNINTQYKSITYNIKDADADNDFQIYSGKGLDGADVVDVSPVAEGDVVVVKGIIKKFNTTYEMDKNSIIVSIVKDTSPKFGATINNETAVSAGGGTKTISVTGNQAWTATATNGATLEPASGEGVGSIVVTIPANTDTENTKEYVVTVSATGFDDIVFNIEQNKAVSAGGQQVEETITFSEQGYDNAQEIVTVTGEHFTITWDKGSNSNTPKYYNTGAAIRAYGGNTFTVTTTEGNITAISLTFASGEGTNEITVDTGTFTTPDWTGSSDAVTFTIGGTSGHRRIASISVTIN